MKDPYSVPKTMRETYEAITALTDDFCRARLNDEYADLCRRMTAKLTRKRPSPLSRRTAAKLGCRRRARGRLGQLRLRQKPGPAY